MFVPNPTNNWRERERREAIVEADNQSIEDWSRFGLPDTRDYKIVDTTGEYMRLVLKISKEAADKQRAVEKRRENDNRPHSVLRGPGCFPEEFFR